MLWKLTHKVLDLLKSHDKMSTTIAALDDDIQAMKLEIARLKARDEALIARTETVASGAATVVVANSIADTSRQIGAPWLPPTDVT